jgi:flagellar hook-basal body complex protein FliE
MTIEAIAAIGSVGNVGEVQGFLPPSAVAEPAPGFGTWFAQEIGAVNTSMVNAEVKVEQLATGETQSLHDVMIHLEEAKLQFQLLAQVRNRLLEAYQEVMRMQV